MALRNYSNQGELWGPSPDLALPAGHLARAISEIVERLDLDRCNRKHRHTAGEPAYDARLMTKVLHLCLRAGDHVGPGDGSTV